MGILNSRGFTLIEIMVVVVILGVLGSLIVPTIITRPQQARVVKAQQDIVTIEQALSLYVLDNGRYPSEAQGLAALVTVPDIPPVPQYYPKGGYLKRLPQDPWGQPYQYYYLGEGTEPEVASLGADGQAGGEGFNADVRHA